MVKGIQAMGLSSLVKEEQKFKGRLFMVYQDRAKPQRKLLLNCSYGLSTQIGCTRKCKECGRNGDYKCDQDWGHLGLLMLLYMHLPTLGKPSQHWISLSICKMRIVIFLFGLGIDSLDCLNIYTEALTPWDPRDLPGAWPGLTPSLSSPTATALGARG